MNALAAATALAGAALLGFAVLGGPLQTVVGRPWPLPGIGPVLPWWTVGALLPAAATLLVAAMRWRRRRARPLSLPGIAAIALALAGGVAIWAVHLARHDRPLTAAHAALVLASLAFALPGRRVQAFVLPAAGAALATLSYGAVWGEARCGRADELPCLVDRGPRVWVPKWFDALGLPVFAELPGADLRGANLRGRDLRLANLQGARLDGAVFAAANLRRARLDAVDAPAGDWSGAHLDGASLRGARLAAADLRRVHAFRLDLRDADLRGADARGASFSHARLDAALLDGLRLEGAYLRFATGWSDLQLTRVHRDAATRLPDGALAQPVGGPLRGGAPGPSLQAAGQEGLQPLAARP